MNARDGEPLTVDPDFESNHGLFTSSPSLQDGTHEWQQEHCHREERVHRPAILRDRNLDSRMDDAGKRG